MKNRRLRSIYYAAAAILAIWLVAGLGYVIAQHSKMTVERVRDYVNSVDLSKLSAEDRARAIRKLADMINALSMEERQRWRRDQDSRDWFSQMTEAEKGQFIDETMPTGFKQMLDAFSQLPDAKRRKIIDDAMKNLQEQAQDNGGAGGGGPNGGAGNAVTSGSDTNALSPELQQKVQMIGLNTFYSQSSPETKAELAPLVEQMQQQLQSGRNFH